MIRLFVEARLVAGVEFLPARVGPRRIVREDGFEAFSGRAKLDKFITGGAGNRTVAAEHALLHPQFLHLLQDHGGGSDVGPEHDGVHAGIFDDLQLVVESRYRPA